MAARDATVGPIIFKRGLASVAGGLAPPSASRPISLARRISPPVIKLPKIYAISDTIVPGSRAQSTHLDLPNCPSIRYAPIPQKIIRNNQNVRVTYINGIP